jgi:uncharacterized protein (TIGR03083 family)
VTADLVDGVRPDQQHAPTPCPDLDVAALVDHLVGATAKFTHSRGVTPSEPGPEGYRSVAAQLLATYRAGAVAEATPVGIVLMETVTHGWDVAIATGQRAPYPDDVCAAALATGTAMLSPEYRGPGRSSAAEVTAADDDPVLDRLVAFLGRDPR